MSAFGETASDAEVERLAQDALDDPDPSIRELAGQMHRAYVLRRIRSLFILAGILVIAVGLGIGAIRLMRKSSRV